MSRIIEDEGVIPARCRGVVEDLQGLGLSPVVSRGGKMISAPTNGIDTDLVRETVGQPRGWVRTEFEYNDQREWSVFVIMS